MTVRIQRLFASKLDLLLSAVKPIRNTLQTPALRQKNRNFNSQQISQTSDVPDIFFFQWRTDRYIVIDIRGEFTLHCFTKLFKNYILKRFHIFYFHSRICGYFKSATLVNITRYQWQIVRKYFYCLIFLCILFKIYSYISTAILYPRRTITLLVHILMHGE